MATVPRGKLRVANRRIEQAYGTWTNLSRLNAVLLGSSYEPDRWLVRLVRLSRLGSRRAEPMAKNQSGHLNGQRDGFAGAARY